MIDTHCHLDASRFDEDRDAVLERAWAAGVEGIVVPAIGPHAWDALLDWPSRDRRIRVALGIHPQLLPDLPEADDDRHLRHLDELLGRRIAVAVGECGLDGGSVQAGASLERQLRIFRRHLELADAHGLPVLVHCLRLHPQLLALLEERPVPRAGMLLHSFSGSAALVRSYVDRGCHFSFAGPVTFPEARRPVEAARAVPLDRLMAETDAPDQAPHPHRGGRSEPSFLPLVVAGLAAAHRIDASDMAQVTSENARRFFRWG